MRGTTDEQGRIMFEDMAGYEEIGAGELASLLGTQDEPFLLDVREPHEVAAWAIPGALNIPLAELSLRSTEVPRQRKVVTVCAAGNRSAVAAAMLAGAGWDVANLSGGMAAWAGVYDAVRVERAAASIVQVRRRAKGCLSYLVGSGTKAFVFDPSLDVGIYEDLAAEAGWTITDVFDTHLHADHLSGARQLAADTGAVLHLNPADPFDFSFEPLSDGDRFELPGGVEVSVAAIHTPGHTEGSTLYFVGDQAVLTGDTLFVDGVGRPDLADRAEEFARNLHRSLHEKVLVLADDTVVLPAHYGDQMRVRPDTPVSATLQELRDGVHALSLPEQEFVSWAAARATPRPPNYVEIVRANMGRSTLADHQLAGLETGPNRCAA